MAAVLLILSEYVVLMMLHLESSAVIHARKGMSVLVVTMKVLAGAGALTFC